jgi:hypothetical protein
VICTVCRDKNKPVAFRAVDNPQLFCRECADHVGHPGVPMPWASLEMLVPIEKEKHAE